MGHRCTYVIKQHGQVRLFYSHWGALTITEDLFWGPSATETFIQSNQTTGEWLDDVWGEGAIALDKDESAAAFFGRHDDKPRSLLARRSRQGNGTGNARRQQFSRPVVNR